MPKFGSRYLFSNPITTRDQFKVLALRRSPRRSNTINANFISISKQPTSSFKTTNLGSNIFCQPKIYIQYYRVIHHKVDETKLILCLFHASQILFKSGFEILRQNNFRHCNQFLCFSFNYEKLIVKSVAKNCKSAYCKNQR